MVLIRVWTFEGLGEPVRTLDPVSVIFAVHWKTLKSDVRPATPQLCVCES